MGLSSVVCAVNCVEERDPVHISSCYSAAQLDASIGF